MGLLDYIGQKAREIPENAKAAYRGLLAAPEELAALFSPEMRQRVNQSMNTPATLDRDKAVGMAMDFLQTTPAGLLGHIVYHGSPHKFGKFDMSKIGTGEGAQAYGHGLYFAESPAVATDYATKLSSAGLAKNKLAQYGGDIDAALTAANERIANYKNLIANGGGGDPRRAQGMLNLAEKDLNDLLAMKSGTLNEAGNLYKVDIPDEAIPRMLDWDKPLSEQADVFNSVLGRLEGTRIGNDLGVYKGKVPMHQFAQNRKYGTKQGAVTGADFYNKLFSDYGIDANNYLKEAGIPGIRYLDGSSRTAGQGTSNFVLFDDQLPRILEINGHPTGLLSYADEAAHGGGLLGKVDNAPMGKQFNWDNPGGGIRTVKVGDTTIDYGFDGKSAHIASLRTPAAKRNKGSARAAMEQFLREADELGIPVKLESSPLDKKTKDLRLFNFYKSLGFEPTGKKINAVGDPEMIRKPNGPRILEVNGQPTGLLSYADEAAQKPKPKKAK